YRDEYLADCLYREGRGSYAGVQSCPQCGTSQPSIRCKDCFGQALVCRLCAARNHYSNPLHMIEEWNGAYFSDISLRDCGLRVQLGNHTLGEQCTFRSAVHRAFHIIHVNGIHAVAVDFCGCPGQPAHRAQLLRAGWWPATAFEPQTCASFQLLRLFHCLNLQGKLAGYDCYKTLELITDGRAMQSIPNWLQPFMNMIRQWRHISMLKRAGRGHNATGVQGTKNGELAVVCRACPIPQVNLPSDWKEAPPSIAYVFPAFLCTILYIHVFSEINVFIRLRQ
ncbi:hypothetical protein BJ138DRAFT_1017351, partial [Hygrophoropsis aurantiaca]